MLLSDSDIIANIRAGRIVIEPYVRDFVQPSSLDITLDTRVRVFNSHDIEYIDVRRVCDASRLIDLGNEGSFMIHPGDFILGSTAERLTLPNDIAAKIEGRSSLGRLGLIIHATAGYVDPGFSGYLTLEISNISRLPIKLYAGMRIGQLAFIMMSSAVERPYGSPELRSKYQGQVGPTPSKVWEDLSGYQAGGESMNRASQVQANELHMYESIGPDRRTDHLQVAHLLGNDSRVILRLDQPGESELAAKLSDLKAQGVDPTRVYIGTWSRLRSVVHEVWPEAELLFEYNSHDRS